jgi:hypothetical protein
MMGLPAPASPKSRTVTVALALLGISAVVSVAVSVMFIHDYAGYADVATRAGLTTEASQSRIQDDISGQHAIDGFSAGAFGFMALALAGSAVWARRLNIGRILACVTAGLQALCCGGVMGFLSLGVWARDVNGEDAYLDAVTRLQYDAQPGWIKALIPTSAALLPILGLVVVILLLLPSSNRFYRPAPAPPAAPAAYYGPPPPAYGPPQAYQPPAAYGSPVYGSPAPQVYETPQVYERPPVYEPPPPEFHTPPPGETSPPWGLDPGTPPWSPPDYGAPGSPPR